MIAPGPRYVCFVRVSTKYQAVTAYGQEAQLQKCRDYATITNGTIIHTIVCQESGGKAAKQRSLRQAIKFCEETGATLLIGVLDRLSRDEPFLHALKASGFKFVNASDPQMNNFSFAMYAALAAHERELASARTKAIQPVLRAKGIRVGAANPKHKFPKDQSQRISRGRRLQLADDKPARDALKREKCIKVLDIVLPLMLQGLGYKRTAEAMNERGIPTFSGKGEWHPGAVRDVMMCAAPDSLKIIEQLRKKASNAKAVSEFAKS